MAVSNSFDFVLTRDTLIQEAMERCGMLRLNKSATSDQLASLGRSLNLKCKALQSDGLQLFTYRDAYLFLEEDEESYLLGPTGDNATESYVKTALGADEASGQTALTVDSITGISASDKLGIELDDGTLQWTTVNGAPSGTTVTATAALTGDAADGNIVFAYTTKIQRPLMIADLFIRDTDDDDTPIELRSLSEYRSMSNKTSTGRMVQAAFDPRLTDARLLTWPSCSDVTDVLGFRYKKPVDDFDATGDNPAYPVDFQEWLVCELSVLVAAKFSLPLAERKWFQDLAREARSDLWDGEDATIQIVPNMR